MVAIADFLIQGIWQYCTNVYKIIKRAFLSTFILREMDEDEKPLQFHEMGLDDRILKAVAKLGWCEPTLIQQKAIPFILEGKDVLAKGRTGSGKTGAFAIPVS